MSSTEKVAPARARTTRDQVEQTRRRRRGENDYGAVKRLAVPEDKLDRTQFAYRWVVDTPGRVDMLRRQDWDLVSDDELSADYPSSRHADVAQNRLALTQRLMRKPLDYYDEDHAVRQKQLDTEMKAAELGQTVLNGPGGNDGLDASSPRVYAPNPSSNKLT